MARAYGDDENARILEVEVQAENPLVVESAEQFLEIWQQSGCKTLEAANFHPETTSHFCAWVRAQGYDAVVLPEQIFEGDLGFELCAGTFGEPQAIVLDTAKARIVAVAA